MAEFIFGMLSQLTGQRLNRWCVLLWSIWLRRNQRLWENKEEQPAQVLARADNLLDNYSRAKSLISHANSTQQNVQRWKKPNAGMVKCNINAGFRKHDNIMGVGLVLRNETGAFMLAKTVCFPVCLESHEGEALGLLTAIQWVRELDYSNVIFELDAKMVVDSFNTIRDDFSKFGAIIKESRQLLSSFLHNSLVEFTRRKANVVAHTLARVTTSTASSHIYHDIPRCIEQFILMEMA